MTSEEGEGRGLLWDRLGLDRKCFRQSGSTCKGTGVGQGQNVPDLQTAKMGALLGQNGGCKTLPYGK